MNINIISRIGNILTKLGRTARFPEYFQKFRQLQIIVGVQNQVLEFILPVALFVVIGGCCCTGFLVIRLSSHIPVTLTVLAIFVFCLIISATHILIPLGASVTLKSEAFLRFWKLQCFSPYRKKQLRSCKNLRISVGLFFYIKKKARGIFLSIVLYHMIVLVISV
jgi:hypothetical protein